MERAIFEGNWNEIRGQIKQAWGRLTDNELKQLEGNQQEIFGMLQKHYGYTKEQAEKLVREFNKNVRH